MREESDSDKFDDHSSSGAHDISTNWGPQIDEQPNIGDWEYPPDDEGLNGLSPWDNWVVPPADYSDGVLIEAMNGTTMMCACTPESTIAEVRKEINRKVTTECCGVLSRLSLAPDMPATIQQVFEVMHKEEFKLAAAGVEDKMLYSNDIDGKDDTSEFYDEILTARRNLHYFCGRGASHLPDYIGSALLSTDGVQKLSDSEPVGDTIRLCAGTWKNIPPNLNDDGDAKFKHQRAEAYWGGDECWSTVNDISVRLSMIAMRINRCVAPFTDDQLFAIMIAEINRVAKKNVAAYTTGGGAVHTLHGTEPRWHPATLLQEPGEEAIKIIKRPFSYKRDKSSTLCCGDFAALPAGDGVGIVSVGDTTEVPADLSKTSGGRIQHDPMLYVGRASGINVQGAYNYMRKPDGMSLVKLKHPVTEAAAAAAFESLTLAGVANVPEHLEQFANILDVAKKDAAATIISKANLSKVVEGSPAVVKLLSAQPDTIDVVQLLTATRATIAVHKRAAERATADAVRALRTRVFAEKDVLQSKASTVAHYIPVDPTVTLRQAFKIGVDRAQTPCADCLDACTMNTLEKLWYNPSTRCREPREALFKDKEGDQRCDKHTPAAISVDSTRFEACTASRINHSKRTDNVTFYVGSSKQKATPVISIQSIVSKLGEIKNIKKGDQLLANYGSDEAWDLDDSGLEITPLLAGDIAGLKKLKKGAMVDITITRRDKAQVTRTFQVAS